MNGIGTTKDRAETVDGSLLDLLAPRPDAGSVAKPSLLNHLLKASIEPAVAEKMELPESESSDNASEKANELDHLDRLESALERARFRRDMEQGSVKVPAPVAEALTGPNVKPPSLPQAPVEGDDLYGGAVETLQTRRKTETLPFDLPTIVRALLRKWHLLLLAGLIGGVLAYGYSRMLPDEYRAIARVLIEPRALRVLDNPVAPRGLNSEGTIAYVQSQVDIIRSSNVLNKVIEDEGLLVDPDFAGRDGIFDHLGKRLGLNALRDVRPVDPKARVMQEVQESLYVGRLNQTFVIEIGLAASDANKTARLTNAIATTYLAEEADAQSDAARSATDDLTARLDQLKANVERSERAVNAHMAESGLVEANGRLVEEDQLARLNDRLAAAVSATAEAKATYNLVRTVDANDVIGSGLPNDIASPTITQLRVEYSRLRNRRDRLAVKLGARHPERIAANAELASARTSIEDEIGRLVASSRKSYERMRAREADLRESVGTLRASTLDNSAAKSQLRELERMLDADRRVYETFLQRSRETSEEKEIKQESARIITAATPPIEKEAPNRRLTALVGAIVGGLLAGLFVLLPMIWRAGRAFVFDEEQPTAVAARTRVAAPPIQQPEAILEPTENSDGRMYPATAATNDIEEPKRTRKRRRRRRKGQARGSRPTREAFVGVCEGPSEKGTQVGEVDVLRAELDRQALERAELRQLVERIGASVEKAQYAAGGNSPSRRINVHSAASGADGERSREPEGMDVAPAHWPAHWPPQ